MRLIKIGTANINTTVGAFKSNADMTRMYMQRMAAEKCTLGLFQEQVIPGYAAEDLVFWPGFVKGQYKQLERLADTSKNLPFPTVFAIGLTVEHGGNLYNCVAVLCKGEILGLVPKEKLPDYGVFYEGRTHSSGIPGVVENTQEGITFGDLIFEFPFGTLGVEVCEDIWSPDGPMRRRAYSGAEVIFNGSDSHWRAGVTETREEMIPTRSADNQAVLVYVNQVGGQDSQVFDGGVYIYQNGRLVFKAPRWKEGLTTQVVDLDETTRGRRENTTWRKDYEAFVKENKLGPFAVSFSEGPSPNQEGYAYPIPSTKNFFLPDSSTPRDPREEYFKDLITAMKTGLAGYFEKTGVFERIVIALSGGKDSALTLMVAWLYAHDRFQFYPYKIKKDNIYDFIQCLSLPTRYNSDTTQNISRMLCEGLGVTLVEESIEEEFNMRVEKLKRMLGPNAEIPRVVLQNIQARIRGPLMWDWAACRKALWIQTGNMSEKAVGYTTIGGDIMGGYSLIGNLPKTVIIELLEYLYKKHSGKALKELLLTKASAELDENQEDEKDLMPFPVLDACIHLFSGKKLMPAEVYLVVRSMWNDEQLKAMRPDYEKGMLKQWVKRFALLFTGNIFKWVQSPQAVHLGNLELDRERALQLPVVQSREWLMLDELDNLPD